MPTPPTPARQPLRIIDLVAGIVIVVIFAAYYLVAILLQPYLA